MEMTETLVEEAAGRDSEHEILDGFPVQFVVVEILDGFPVQFVAMEILDGFPVQFVAVAFR